MPAYRKEDLYPDVAQLQHEAPDRFGSGRLVGRNLILTARHLVTSESAVIKKRWQVRLFGGRPKDGANWLWHDAEVIWTGKSNLDLALLAVRPKGDTPMRPKLTLRVAKAERVRGHRVRGLGFPLGARLDGRRELIAPIGDLTDEGRPSLTWGIDQSFIPQTPKEDWPGFSGAGVLLEESDDDRVLWLYGVAQDVPPKFNRQLAVARLEKALEDADFRRVLTDAEVPDEPAEDPTERAVIFSPPPKVVPHQLEPPPKDFAGRVAELEDLMLMAKSGGVIISGLGGVGKTTLAFKLADQLTQYYPDAQFYVDLRGINPQPLSSADAMTHVISAYYPNITLPDKEPELKGLYLSVLHHKRVLLLMDNVKDAAQVRPLLPPTSCILIVTSRQHFTLPGMRSKKLGVLSPKDARMMLLRISERINNVADDIAQLCGRLPLALRAAGSLLYAEDDLSPLLYVEKLRNERTRLEKIGTEGVPIGVESSFNLSYMHLDEATARVFRMLAVFPESFDAMAEEIVCEDVGLVHLRNLRRYSLTEWNHITKRYRLHDLVRLFAASRLVEFENQDCKLRYTQYYLEYANDKASDNDALNADYFNILQALKEAYQISQHGNMSSDLVRLFIETIKKFARFLGYRAEFQKRIEWGKKALEVAERQVSHDSAIIAELCASVIAWPLLQMGEWEQAKICAQKGVDAALQCQSPYWAGQAARTLSGIARDLQEADEARHWAKEALAYARQSGDVMLKRGAILDLGYAAMVARNFTQAERLFRVLVKLAQQENDQERIPARMGDFGLAMLNQCRLEEASKLFEDASPIVEALNEDRHHVMTAELKFNLAKVEELRGNGSRAQELASEGRRIFNLLGVKRPPRVEQFVYVTR